MTNRAPTADNIADLPSLHETAEDRKRRLRREEQRRYRQRYPEKRAAANRRYYAAHKERWKVYAENRKERQKATN